MDISLDKIKKVREKSGAGINECKKVLEETAGDVEKALKILKERSTLIASSKEGRELKAGTIEVVFQEKDGITELVMVSLLCETDFVAKNEDFKNGARQIAKIYLEERDEKIISEKVQEIINSLIQKIRENIKLGEVKKVKGEVINFYVHDIIKGAVVILDGGTKELAKDIAMQIVAMSPQTKEELLNQIFIKNPEITIESLLKQNNCGIKEYFEIKI